MYRKAILVTGNAGILELLQSSFLARNGFDLLAADSGGDAFGWVEEHDPALVVLDMDRPELAECRRRILADRILQDTHLLLVCSEPPDFEPRPGCEAVLAKPVDNNRLLTAVCRLLRIHQPAADRPEIRLRARSGQSPDDLKPARTCNLTTGGVFLETKQLYPVDTPIFLEMLLPRSRRPLCCRGRIAWVNHPEWIKKKDLPPGMGVQFLHLGREEKAALDKLLRSFQSGT